MKNHITRTIAFVMVLLMLVSSVPSSVLPVLALGETDATQSESAQSIFDSVTLGKDTVTNTESYLAGATSITNGQNKTIPMVDSSLSPYEPYSTEDEDHPFLPGGSAWIDLSKIYYGAPATQNYPITKWSANTSVYNTTALGTTYGLSYGAGDSEKYAIKDLNLIDEFTWAGSDEYNADDIASNDFISEVYKDTSGNAVSENGIINSTDHGVRHSSDAESYGNYIHTITTKYPATETEAAIEARAYNRYDAMQGKWGITLDKNVKSVTWRASYVQQYYGTTNTDASHLNNSYLYLTDTPYLYYSTEALDSTKLAISLLIGTPVQTERIDGSNTTYVATEKYDADGEVKADGNVEYVYRWYTITDNAVRPGIDDPNTPEDESNMDASMIPNITVSPIVMQDNNEDNNSDINITLKYIAEGGYKINSYANTSTNKVVYAEANANHLNPIALADTDPDSTEDTDALYVSGSVTGCIDFTQVLPLLMAESTANAADKAGNGRQAVKYRIAQIRVDTETEAGKEDSAARINYLYFGPALSTVFTPQTTLGNTVNGGNWQYAMTETNIGDANSIYGEEIGVAKNHRFETGWAMSYTNGWNNGEAVSITNTPNDPQKITIDTFGMGDGQIISTPASFPSSFYGSTSGSVWEYTPVGSNEKVQLETRKVKGVDYVSVEIPIRKWIDVAGDSRKLTFTLEMERFVNGICPSFSLWGNDDGSLGSGHSSKGTRFNNETILAVFGEEQAPYMLDNATFFPTLIDKTTGQSVVYNGQKVETLYSTSDSYVVGEDYNVVKDASTGILYYINGSTYYTRKQKQDSSNADILLYFYDGTYTGEKDKQFLYYTKTGEIKDFSYNVITDLTLSDLTPLYDFEVATPPNPNTLRSVCETEETWVDMLRSPYMLRDNCVLKGANTNAGITDMVGYVFVTTLRIAVPVGTVMSIQNMKAEGNSAGLNAYSASGEIVEAYDGGTGAQPELTLGKKSEAAAYGPFFQYNSDYTIHDLLDTEWLNGDDGAEMVTIAGKADENQKIYGVPYTCVTANSTYNRLVYKYPYGAGFGDTTNNSYSFTDSTGTTYSGTNFGNVSRTSTVMVYGTVKFTGKSQNYYNEVWGLIGYEETYGWIRLQHTGASSTNAVTPNWNAQASNGTLAFSDTYASIGDINITTKTDEWLAKLRDNWVISNFSDNSNKDATLAMAYNKSANIPGLRSEVGNASVLAAQTSYIKSNRKLAAFEFGFTTRSDTEWRNISLSRVFTNPILLTNNADGDQKTWPVLYYDFDQFMGNAFNGNMVIALTLKAADGTTRLYYLEGGNTSNGGKLVNLEDAGSSLYSGYEACGYYSFRDIMNTWKNSDDKTQSISIIGINIEYSIAPTSSIYTGTNTSGSTTIRRLEVWQDQTAYVDAMYTEKGYLNSDTTNAQLNDRIADSFNLVNDAFYSVHNERDDNDSEPYKKQNSNRGWDAWIDFGDGTKEYSRDNYETDGKFQYTSSVGNLRVWIPAGKTGKVIFDSDRSFNTANYKYLYYSYSMRDVETGIAAEDSGKSWVNISVRQKLYVSEGLTENSTTTGDNWVWSSATTSGGTSVSGAINLSTTELESVNQIVFYLNNNESDTAEFYINYVYLSNVLPTTEIVTEMEKTEYQYYYLMDNTGDRYSARFPTLDNPTGQVTGENTDKDRVNPIKVARGNNMYEGTFFNGEPLSSYGTATDDGKGGTAGGYSNEYSITEGIDEIEMYAYLRYIWFYEGKNDVEDTKDIQDFYTFKDTNGDGVGNSYDMLWSYGRWNTGEGESARNTMYIAGTATAAQKQDYIYGNLIRRYATENYVLLRAGITPKTYTTYFDANGGEFLYDSSPAYITNLQQVTENNYYVTSNTVLGYFKQPNLLDSMYGEVGAPTDTFLKKPGYKFVRWDHYDYYGQIDNTFNATEGTARLATYIKKNDPGVDYFVAVWEEDPDYEDITYTADFYGTAEDQANAAEPYRTITVGDEASTKDDLNGRFVLTIPSNSIFYDGKTRTTIYGWKAVGDTTNKVYSAGEKVYLLKDTDFIPVTEGANGNTFEITLKNAKLYVMTTNNRLQPVEKYGATVAPSDDTYVYSNVSENYLLTAVPNGAIDGYGWTEVARTDGSKLYLNEKTVTILSGNKTSYSFTAHEDIKISYDQLIGTIKESDDKILSDDTINDDTVSFYKKQNYAFVTTSTDNASKTNKQAVYFTSQYEMPEGYTAVACGTLLTKDTYYNAYDESTRESTFRLNEDTVTTETITKKTYKTMDTTGILMVQATATNSVKEYAVYIAHNKSEPTLYYARGYVIYCKDGEEGTKYYIAYSDVIACGLGTPVSTT